MRIRDGNHARYSSHLPVLIRAMAATSGDVLELGTGVFSTPVLHWMCAPAERRLLSCEGDAAFAAIAQQWARPWHEIRHVADWDAEDIDRRYWDLVFVDHEAARRRIELRRLADRALLLVVHDTCGRDDRHYRYSEVWPLFKYRWQFQLERPRTSVVSNFADPARLLRW